MLDHGSLRAAHRRDRRDAGDGSDQARRRCRHFAQRQDADLRRDERRVAHSEGHEGSGVRRLLGLALSAWVVTAAAECLLYERDVTLAGVVNYRAKSAAILE